MSSRKCLNGVVICGSRNSGRNCVHARSVTGRHKVKQNK